MLGFGTHYEAFFGIPMSYAKRLLVVKLRTLIRAILMIFKEGKFNEF